jgi:4-amino-4-deoxychorismate lyase
MGVKFLSYAPNLAASRHAAEEGFDDALMLTTDGVILEGPTFTVAWVVDGVLETPSMDLGLLDSVTRRFVLEDAHSLGIEVRQGRWTLQRLAEADEVMAMSTTREVQGVSDVGGVKFGEGPITAELSRAFTKRIKSLTQ